MAQIHDPRVLRLSWCPANDKFGAAVADWVDRLKKRLRVFPRDLQGRALVLQDVNAPGADRAALREGPWTDFVAVYTMDYCLLCSGMPEDSDLLHALPFLGEPGRQLWLVRLEHGDPADSEVAGVRPWQSDGWLMLPAREVEQPLALDDGELQTQCVQPLRARSPSPSAAAHGDDSDADDA